MNTLQKSSTEFEADLENTRKEIAVAESQLSTLESSIEEKIKLSILEGRNYSESARERDDAEAARLEKRIADLRRLLPVYNEGIDQATATERGYEIDRLTVELEDLENQAGIEWDSLTTAWNAFLEVDQAIHGLHRDWYAKMQRLRVLSGGKCEQRNFPLSESPLCGLNGPRREFRRAEYLKRAPGWILSTGSPLHRTH